MNNIHEWINSGILLLLAVAYFLQDRSLKYMKTAMTAIDPEKIKKAQEYIEQGKEYELKIKMQDKLREITEFTGERFQQVNKDFLQQFNELINIPFKIMKDKDWQFREQHLAYYPRCAEILREMLEAYDKGELPPPKSEDLGKG